MNIFYLHPNPKICAQQHVDKHVVKMILEYAQLLSTAHRFLDGTEILKTTNFGRQIKLWQLPDERDAVLYKATHIQHPSAIWTRQSDANYVFLWQLFSCLLDEYTFRYEKIHATSRLLLPLKSLPSNILVASFSQPTPAMPDEYKIANDSMSSYRSYYRGSKSHLFAWKKRVIPDWLSTS
ncbi:MAG: hypothetical protein PHN45_00920 [Methylococcales bacterium]|nr:hypothetical protein [Methylococcales bacterium]MDD5753301.1 hypothetical protein [Methylococcales bacterium]